MLVQFLSWLVFHLVFPNWKMVMLSVMLRAVVPFLMERYTTSFCPSKIKCLTVAIVPGALLSYQVALRVAQLISVLLSTWPWKPWKTFAAVIVSVLLKRRFTLDDLPVTASKFAKACNKKIRDGVTAWIFNGTPELKSIGKDGRIRNWGALARAISRGRLQELRIQDCDLCGHFLCKFAKSFQPNHTIEVLDLSCNGIKSNKDLQWVMDIVSKCSSLKQLNLSGNPGIFNLGIWKVSIAEEKLDKFILMIRNKKISQLQLNNIALSGQHGGEILARLIRDNGHLKLLSASGNTLLQPASLRALKPALLSGNVALENLDLSNVCAARGGAFDEPDILVDAIVQGRKLNTLNGLKVLALNYCFVQGSLLPCMARLLEGGTNIEELKFYGRFGLVGSHFEESDADVERLLLAAAASSLNDEYYTNMVNASMEGL